MLLRLPNCVNVVFVALSVRLDWPIGEIDQFQQPTGANGVNIFKLINIH